MNIYLSNEKNLNATDDFLDGKIAYMDFGDWLNAQMVERGMSQSDLARAAKVSNTAISNVLSGTRSPGPEFCTAIAKALRLSPVYVFRVAGLLPPESGEMDEETQKMLSLFGQMSEDEQEQMIAMAQFFIDRRTSKARGRARPAEG